MKKTNRRSASAKSPSASTEQLGATQATVLSNGVLIVTENLPAVRSASLGVYLDIGSRDESPRTNGLSHLYEHMVFKGTPKFSPLQIVQRFEASGGQINAYTSKEQTCLHAKVVDSEVEGGMGMLLNMALDSHFDAGELKKEKEVIVEEIHSVDDSPEEHVYEMFSEAIFGDHALGRPIAGTDKSVRSLQRADLLAHQELTRHQVPVLITASGKVDHKSLVDIASKAYKLPVAKATPADPGMVGWLRAHPSEKKSPTAGAKAPQALPMRTRTARDFPEFKARHLVDKRKVQQCNVLLGTPIFGWEDSRRMALFLLNLMFGDGMSSRLFQSVREERGLVYSIYSSPEFMIGCGVFSIGLATEAGDLPKALSAISQEIKRLKKEGLSAAELQAAKRNLRGSVLLGLESTNTRMGSLARQIGYGPGIEGVNQFLERAEKVTLAQIRACIDQIFQKEKWSSAVVGPKSLDLNIGSALRF
jgi:predicted Zn-dependent peptidase